jgi:Rrf2 family protein
MLSGTAEYALRAVVYLAGHPDESPVAARELSEAVDVPPNYMAKILHELGRAGILRSSRGKGGGFELAVSATELSLLRVVSRFGNLSDEPRCLMGRPKCGDRDPCPAHEHWKQTADQVARFFRETSVADVLSPRNKTRGG